MIPLGIMQQQQITPAGDVILVQDSFTDSDSTVLSAHDPDINTVGDPWYLMYGGSVTIVSNEVVSAGSVSYHAIDVDESEVTVSCTCTQPGYILISARSAAQVNSGWRAYAPTSGVVQLWENGSNRASGTTSTVSGTPHELKLVCAGSSIKVYLDDVLEIDYRATSYLGYGTFCGIQGESGSTFDDFLVTTPPHAWQPKDIDGQILWLDSTDLSTLWQDSARTVPVDTPGDLVYRWDDKSKLGRIWYQTTAAYRPLYTESFNSSYPGVDFQASRGGGLTGTTSHVSSEYTMFMVLTGDHAGGDSDQYLFDTQTGRFIFYHESGAGLSVYDGTTYSGSAHVTTTPAILTAVLDDTDATSAYAELNRVGLVAGFDYTPRALTGAQVLGNIYNYSGAYEWDGMIASFLIYDRVLTSGEIVLVEDYLAAQYGISL